MPGNVHTFVIATILGDANFMRENVRKSFSDRVYIEVAVTDGYHWRMEGLATAADTVRIFAVARVTLLSWVYLRLYGQFCNSVISTARTVDRWIRNGAGRAHTDTYNTSLYLRRFGLCVVNTVSA